MRIFLLFISLFVFNNGFSQTSVNDFGKKTFDEVKNTESYTPCEVTEKQTITYWLAVIGISLKG